MTRPWSAGAATGIGSVPGDDPREAMRLVFGELPDLPYLPELPGRGAGADMIGRASAVLVDLPVEIVPTGWRLAAHPGRDERWARDLLERDLDALEEVAGAHTGTLKLQVCGPWTLAAAIELPSGHRVVSDHGATRDLIDSLTEGIRLHLAAVASRVPGAALVLQLDEPSLPAVLGGRVGTPSGWGTVRSVPAADVEQSLAGVLSVAAEGSRVLHCCAADAPLALLRGAGADAIALDATLISSSHLDQIGEAIDAGLAILLGVAPSTDAGVTAAGLRGRIDRLWGDLGFDPARLAEVIVPTPACGLAGASPGYVRRVLQMLREVGQELLVDRS